MSKFSTNLADLLADLALAKEGCSFNGALASGGNLLNPSIFVPLGKPQRASAQSFRTTDYSASGLRMARTFRLPSITRTMAIGLAAGS